jgi:hypothetical protein
MPYKLTQNKSPSRALGLLSVYDKNTTIPTEDIIVLFIIRCENELAARIMSRSHCKIARRNGLNFLNTLGRIIFY